MYPSSGTLVIKSDACPSCLVFDIWFTSLVAVLFIVNTTSPWIQFSVFQLVTAVHVLNILMDIYNNIAKTEKIGTLSNYVFFVLNKASTFLLTYISSQLSTLKETVLSHFQIYNDLFYSSESFCTFHLYHTFHYLLCKNKLTNFQVLLVGILFQNELKMFRFCSFHFVTRLKIIYIYAIVELDKSKYKQQCKSKTNSKITGLRAFDLL